MSGYDIIGGDRRVNREPWQGRIIALYVSSVILIIAVFGLAGCDGQPLDRSRTWLEETISSAEDGGTIELAPGTYIVNGVITKNLTIRGMGDSPTEVVLEGGQRGHPVLRVDGEKKIRVVIENLTLKGAKGGPTECASKDLKNIICPDGLQVQGKAEVVLRHLTVTENGRMGIYVRDSGDISIDDSRISKNGRIGLFIRHHAKVKVDGTLIADNNEGVNVTGWATLSMSEAKIIDNPSYGLFVAGQADCTLSHSAIRGNGKNGIALAQEAQISLIATEVTANKGWGIIKISYPTPFSGAIEIDEESSLEGNEMGEIGSM